MLINDHFQNYKVYNIPKAQLVIADIPYNIGKNAYGSNPSWYIGGDNANGESNLAGKEFFDTDKDFRISEFLFNELLESSKLSSEYLNTELKKLRIEGKIRRGKTINDIWIEIIK